MLVNPCSGAIQYPYYLVSIFSRHPVPILRVFAVNLHVFSTSTGKFVVNSRRDVNAFPRAF